MHGRGCARVVVGLILAAATTTALAGPTDPKPTVVDIKPYKDKLLVFQDAKGGTYVVLREADQDKQIFFGTGKTLYQQKVIGGSSNGTAWSISTWAPRIAELRPGQLSRKPDDTYEKSCDGKDDVALTQITGDKAKAILDKYAFMTQASMRRPYLLARDDAGVYYYVDMLPPRRDAADSYHGTSHRVFVGKKGAMKLLPLTDVASDSAGDVFSTKTGDLRLVKNADETKMNTVWVKGEKRTSLAWLDVDVNSRLIFRDLGVYTFIGTLCDNL